MKMGNLQENLYIFNDYNAKTLTYLFHYRYRFDNLSFLIE